MTNIEIFVDSFMYFIRNISASGVFMSVVAVFALLGVIDKLRGNKHGYGEHFNRGFHTMGPLALIIVGVMVVSPVIFRIIFPIVTPLYYLIGISPAMFPGALLPMDMGGFSLAIQMTDNAAIYYYSGLMVASLMGMTVAFTVPFALNVLKKEDHALFATGILLGFITLPIGIILGGMVMAVTTTPLPFSLLIINTLPVIVLAIVVAVGLVYKQERTLKIFGGFGKGIVTIAAVSPGIAIFQYLTGVRLPLFYLMVEYDPVLGNTPLYYGLMVVGQIALVLAGAFPMLLFISRRLKKVITKFGNKVGINEEASTGLVVQLANHIPMWNSIEKMDDRGKLINITFCVSASFVFGDVLAFTNAINPEMVLPVTVAKLTGGVLAVCLAIFMLNKKILKY